MSRIGIIASLALSVLASLSAGCADDPTGSAEQTSPPHLPSARPTPPSTTQAPVSTTTSAATTEPSDDRRFTFPLRPASVADYSQTHHSYPATDIFAPCGTDVVSPVAGTVAHVSTTDTWNPGSDLPADRGGLSVTIVDGDGVRFYMSHLGALTDEVVTGAVVQVGQPIAFVGETGNAAGTGCHVHFGISPWCGDDGEDWDVRRGVVWPAPYLDAWRSSTHRSPSAEVGVAQRTACR